MASTLRHFENGGFTTSPFFEWRTNDATKPVAHPKSATCNVTTTMSPKLKWQRPRTTCRHQDRKATLPGNPASTNAKMARLFVRHFENGNEISSPFLKGSCIRCHFQNGDQN